MRFRLLKWVSLGLGALIVLTLIAVLVVVWVVDPNTFKPRIEAAVRDATGREFALVGDIELGFFPWLALRAGAGRFGNAPGFGDQPMVSWRRAQLGAKLLPLLRGRLVADRVILEGADVRLLRRADGSANWQGIGGDAPADPDAGSMDLRIDGIEIRDSRISFTDETVPRTVAITSLDLSTDGIAPGEPYTDTEISGVLHMDGFAPEGVPFRIAVPEVVAAGDLSRLQVDEFSLAFGAFEAEGQLHGSLAQAPRLNGSIASNVFDPRALLASMGAQPPKTTDASALGRLRFTATWRFDAGTASIEPFTMTLDDTRFSGRFSGRLAADASGAPTGEFALRGDRLDLGRYIPPADPESEPFVLPVAALKRLAFRGSIDFDEATLGDVSMKGVTLRLLLDEQGLRQDGAAKAP